MHRYYVCSLSAIPCIECDYLHVHSHRSFPLVPGIISFGLGFANYTPLYILICNPSEILITALRLTCDMCVQVSSGNLSSPICRAINAKWGHHVYIF